MIVLAGGVIGALLGGIIARKRGGTVLDIAQYATATGIALALIGLVITVFVHRAAVMG